MSGKNSPDDLVFEVSLSKGITTHLRHCGTEAEIGSTVVQFLNIAGGGGWWLASRNEVVEVRVVPRDSKPKGAAPSSGAHSFDPMKKGDGL